MERVLGVGGYFLRAADPVALGAWYRDCLGLDADENGLWRQEAGVTVFATFEAGTGYFGSRAQQTMLNFRVRDLDAMLAQLRAKGADVASETQDMEGVGRFGWVTDPEGTRIELWQPSELCRRSRGDPQAAGRVGEGCYQGLEPGWLVTDAGHGDRQAGLSRAVRAAHEHTHRDEAAF
jgi:predicted enzyme related to lactoylglutathione lyase